MLVLQVGQARFGKPECKPRFSGSERGGGGYEREARADYKTKRREEELPRRYFTLLCDHC